MSDKSTRLAAYVCFECRKSFKRPSRYGDIDQRPCPDCGESAYRVNQKFKAPPKDDRPAWAIARYLFEHGWRFQSLDHIQPPPSYPRTLEEAQEFIRRDSGRFDPLSRDQP